MSEDDYEHEIDEQISKNHYKLLEAVTQLDKGQRVKKPRRSEPSIEVSEFHLVNGGSNAGTEVRLEELAKSLGQRSSHTDIGCKIQAVQRKATTLTKPLEKPAAERIKRAVGFEHIKEHLGKWDAIVTQNRTSNSLTFPLKQHVLSAKLETSNVFLKRFTVQSELQKELAALEPAVEEKVEKPKNETSMSLEQITERRRDAARLRAQQSYKEAKAHRQNKIKSKKFHRIERKQKTKQQLKEFEQLQKTDPEAALAKLELLEKSRAEERMSLRHKSTGQWAKNKQIRAKYDRESRQVLAQQLSISRDLTQKVSKDNETSDEDEENPENTIQKSKSDQDNPWMSATKTDSEIDAFISTYRKYWNENNKTNRSNEPEDTKGSESDKVEEKPIADTFPMPRMDDVPEALNPVERVIVERPDLIFDDADVAETENSDDENSKKYDKPLAGKRKSERKGKSPATKKKKTVKAASTSSWNVSQTLDGSESPRKPETVDIDDIFETISEQIEKKVSSKLDRLKNRQASSSKQPKTSKKPKKKNLKGPVDLSFKKEARRPVIDEEMNETRGTDAAMTEDDTSSLRALAKLDLEIKKKSKEAEIDPNKFINVKPKYLKTQLPDVITGGEEGLDDSEDEETYRNLIGEAFADDDVVEEFRKEKDDEVKNGQPENLDLSLPGWGSWGGKNIQVSARKKRRFIMKFPKSGPRKDVNKGDVIIIEEKDPKIKAHQVSELPFPFTSVQDFEASIRAPIGRTFVPENAHRRLIEPSVKTKLGKIIEPMDEQSLVNVPKSKKVIRNGTGTKMNRKKKSKLKPKRPSVKT